MLRPRHLLIVPVTLIALAQTRPGYQTQARYRTEADAIRHGQNLGLGEARLAGVTKLVAGSTADFPLRFTVGKAGIKTGGGIALANAHGIAGEFGGAHPQIQDPAAENYLTFKTSTGAALEWTPSPATLGV